MPSNNTASTRSLREFKKTVLKELAGRKVNSQAQPAHKTNLLGRPFQLGELERASGGSAFTPDERALADRAFEELKRDGYIRPTYSDLAAPEDWVEITDVGKSLLDRDLKDQIDTELEAISPHLVELRRGMWDATERDAPDAPRQAAHSARELIDQLLRTSPPECTTRKQRFRHLMKTRGAESQTNLEVLEANAELVEAEHKAMLKSAHLPRSTAHKDVLPSIHAPKGSCRFCSHSS